MAKYSELIILCPSFKRLVTSAMATTAGMPYSLATLKNHISQLTAAISREILGIELGY